jgi:hypothetical protein
MRRSRWRFSGFNGKICWWLVVEAEAEQEGREKKEEGR